MIKEITETLIGILSRFKGVNYVKYTGDDLINQQQNNKTLQAYIDDVQLHQFNITNDICKVEYQIYILGFPDDDNTVLDIQDKCFDVALYTLAYIENEKDFAGVLRLYDYSILTLSRYSEQSNAGVKLSVVLEYPRRICDLEDHFNDEPYEEEKDHEITINDNEVGTITINPIHIKPNRQC